MQFRDTSPVRRSFWYTSLAFVLFVAFVMLGGVLQVMGFIGLLATTLGLLTDRGNVYVNDSEIRFRNTVWGTVGYDGISTVEMYYPDVRSGEWWFLITEAQKQIVQASLKPAIAIGLKKPTWLWHIYPFPYPVRLKSVRVYLEEDDETRFMDFVQSKLPNPVDS